ncbi:MAG: ImmA/IrrE family metallo-endopeptidase [Planctomycetaceae bacterium]
MNAANPIKKLYRRLSEVGLTRTYVKKTALPSWWEDDVASNPSGYAQGLLLLSRHLGLELSSLQSEDEPIRLRDFGTCKFKKRSDVSEDDLALARVLATRAAQLAASAVSTPAVTIPIHADEIRQQILSDDTHWVGLNELLGYCWSIGLPVLHLDHFPKNAKRPDGFAARVNGRPVIVLCRHAKHSAWLLFILAHELGHLALGHVPEEGTLIDEKLDEESVDLEEQQANAFAIELLSGRTSRRFIATDRWPNAEELARLAQETGRRSMIDPGHIVLHYAHSMGKSFFPVAQAALKFLDPHDDAVAKVRSKMAGNLDWSRLPEDSSEFLMKITQHGPSE